MEVEIKKWGNSLALRLPKSITEKLDIKKNSRLSLDLKGKKLILTSKTKEQQLANLLKKVKKQKEAEWGGSFGNEW